MPSSDKPITIVLIDGQFPDYYALLKVLRNASRRDIIAAYRNVARDMHPDKVGGGQKQNEQMAHINNARDILTRDKKRAQYDARLREYEWQRSYSQSNPGLNSPKAGSQPSRPQPGKPNPSRPSQARSSDGAWRFAGPPPDPWQEQYRRSRSESYRPPPIAADIWRRTGYVPQGHSWGAYGHCVPPSSFWPFDAYHQGHRPPENSAWMQHRHQGMTLGQWLRQVCEISIRVCDIAGYIENCFPKIVHDSRVRFRSRPGFLPIPVQCLYDKSRHPEEDPEIHYRVQFGNEVIQEVMQFVANSYFAVRGRIDEAVRLQPREAAEVLIHYRGTLEKIGGLLQGTLDQLHNIERQLQDWNVTARAILEYQLIIVEVWERMIAFPESVNYHIFDTFRRPLGQWQGDWGRVFFGHETFKKPSKQQAERSGQPPTPAPAPKKSTTQEGGRTTKKSKSKSSSENRMDVDPAPISTTQFSVSSGTKNYNTWGAMDKIE